jgi:hypothetical protein
MEELFATFKNIPINLEAYKKLFKKIEELDICYYHYSRKYLNEVDLLLIPYNFILN